MGSHEDEPPPIAPYPFWQSSAPRPQRAPARGPAPVPPARDPAAADPAPYDQDQDLATAAYDVMAPDNAPTEVHPVISTEPSGLTRRGRRQGSPAATPRPSESRGARARAARFRTTSDASSPIDLTDAVFDQTGSDVASPAERIDLTALEQEPVDETVTRRRRTGNRRDGDRRAEGRRTDTDGPAEDRADGTPGEGLAVSDALSDTSGDRTDDHALAGLRSGVTGFRLRSFTEGVPRSLLVAVGAAVAVVVLILGVSLLGGSGNKDDDAPAADSNGTTAVAPGLDSGKALADLTPLEPTEAQAALAKAKASVPGTVIQALSWSDKNGRNAVVTTAETTADGTALRVVQVAGLDGKAHELRTMRDPNLPVCGSKASGGSAAFTPNALVVRDLNADGIAEVVVGWSSRCAGGDTKSTVRLALLSNGEKFIIRGTGVIGQAGSGDTAPDPAASRWPKGFLSDLTTYYRSLYY